MSIPKKSGKRKGGAFRGKRGRKGGPLRRPTARSIITNTASVRENYSFNINDGVLSYFTENLSNATFDRAQLVASAFQEYRVKYIKLTFRPSADTWPVGAGPIPQMYFMYNKAAAIPTNATVQTLLDMGCRPIRYDDKNITRSWKPTVLIGADQNAPASQLEASMIKTTPWLSTNLFAQNPGATWAPSNVEHYGCVFTVTKPSPTTPAIAYNVDVEVVFQFRKPLAQVPPSDQVNNNVKIKDGQVVPIVSQVTN